MLDPLGPNRPLSKPQRGLSLPSAEPGPEADRFEESPASGELRPLSLGFRQESLPRPMYPEERAKYQGWFPKLEVDKSLITAEQTRRYNCISWTTGNTRSWDWPPDMYPELSAREAFTAYYRERGFSPITAEEAQAQVGSGSQVVAYWEDPAEPTHGSVAGPGHLDRWESKCGSAARLTHGRDELESDLYGTIRGYFVKAADAPPPAEPPPPPPSEWTRRLENKLEQRLQTVPLATRERFHESYHRWLEFRESDAISSQSNPHKHCQGQAFQQLCQLGPDALPLVMSKIQEGDFFCHALAQALTRRDDGFQLADASPPPLKPHNPRTNEQDKARQILGQWLDSDW